HNGLRSIIGELGNEQFSRLRVGIGDPGRNSADHVLSRFHPSERRRLDELLDAAADAVEAWAREGTNKAANRFNPFELRPADEDRLAPAGEVDGPPGVDGIRRTKTGWRRVLSLGRGDGWERRLVGRDRQGDAPNVERPAFDSAEAEIEAHAASAARLADAAVPKRQGPGRR